MRVHPTSSSAGAARLTPGEDLVLRLAEGNALDTPQGVAADDHLDPEARARLDDEALEVLARWRDAFDGPLTVDGLCLPFVCEWPLMLIVMAALRAGAGLQAAVERYRPPRLVLVGGDEVDRGLVEAVAAGAGIPADFQAAPTVAVASVERASGSLAQRVRRRAVATLLRAGAPTAMRTGSVLALSYWPLVPLLDRLLDQPDLRVAIALEKRPAGPRRGLRAMLDGGWLGRAGPLSRRRGRRRLGAALEAALARPAPELGVRGLRLEAALHPSLLRHVAEAGAEHLATAATIRAAYRRHRPRLVLATYDTEPLPRLVVSLAREAGIRTFLLSHGAYLMPQTLKDMELADEAAIYSEAVGVPGMRRDRPVHAVGYPMPYEPRPEPATAPGAAPRVVVLGQNGHPYTSRFDERVVVRHYVAALAALEATLPEAEVVLRPHPSQDLAPVRAVLGRYPRLRGSVDSASDLHELVGSADLCVGSLSTSTLQAALTGTTVAVLNVTGFDWTWPLGGETPVPIARDAEELAAVVRRWQTQGSLPGQDALVEALGADRPGAVDRLARLVTAAAGRPGAG